MKEIFLTVLDMKIKKSLQNLFPAIWEIETSGNYNSFRWKAEITKWEQLK